MIHLFKKINYNEILFLIYIQIILKFGFFSFFDFLDNVLSINQFVAILISTISIAFCGFFMNLFLKQENKKTKDNLFKLIVIFSIISLTSGFYEVYTSGKFEHMFIILIYWLVVSIVPYFFSGRAFFRDVLIAFFLSSVVLLFWFENKPQNLSQQEWFVFVKLETILIIFSILMFNGMLVRMIIFSLINFKKDQIFNNPTLPVVYGILKTKNITIIISVLLNILALTISVLIVKNTFVFLVEFILAFVPIFYLNPVVRLAKTKNDYEIVMKRLDYTLVFSIGIFLPVSAIIIKHAYY